MGKYGRQRARASNRQSKRQTAQSQADLVWQRPPDSECDERRIVTELSQTTRYVERTIRARSNGMLVEFAVVLAKLEDEQWREILCIDTCNHGTVQRHRDGHAEPEPITSIASPEVIQAALSDAIDEVFALYEEQGI